MDENIRLPIDIDPSNGLAGINVLGGGIEGLITKSGSLKEKFGSMLSAIGPGGIITGVVAGFTALQAIIEAVGSSTSRAAKRFIEMGEAEKQAVKNSGDDIAKLNALVNTMRDVTLSISTRINAQNTLQKLYPQWLSNLTLETVNSKQAAVAIDGLTRSLQANALAQVFANKVAEKQAELFDLNRKLAKVQEEFNKTSTLFGSTDRIGLKGFMKEIQSDINKTKEELNDYQTALQGAINKQQEFKNPALRGGGIEGLIKASKEQAVEVKFKPKKLTPAEIKDLFTNFGPDNFLGGIPLAVRPVVEEKGLSDLERKVSGLFKDPSALQFAQGIEFGFDKIIQKMKEVSDQARQVASDVTGLVMPAFSNLIDAITSGDNPLKAFFAGIQESIKDVIKQLIAAQIKALVLKLITGGGGGGLAGGALGLLGGGGVANMGFNGGIGSLAFQPVELTLKGGQLNGLLTLQNQRDGRAFG